MEGKAPRVFCSSLGFAGKEEGVGVFLQGLGALLVLAEELSYPLSSRRCLEISVTSGKCWPEGQCVGWHGDRQVVSPQDRAH